MGRFFNGQVKNDKQKLIKYGAIGGGILLILIVIFLIVGNNRGKSPILEIHESMEIEVNGEIPQTMDFFSEFDNFDEKDIEVDLSRVDFTTPGEYTAKITAKGVGDADVKITIVDTKAPELELKTLSIASGATYAIEDFISGCKDNSDTECTIKYYDKHQDQNGNIINFGGFTADGEYVIMIVAYDDSGNESAVQSTTLTIGQGGQGGTVTPVTCEYGDLTINQDLGYPLAVTVGDVNSNCALNRDLWDNKSVQTPVDSFYNKDYIRLQEQMKPILQREYPKGARIVAYPNYVAILNEEVKGLVGYAIHVKVYIANSDTTENVNTDKNLKLDYYIRSDGTREYEKNVYNLGK